MLEQVRYVRLPAPDLAAASAFACDVVGLEAAGGSDGVARFRSDGRGYTVCFDAAASAPVLGVEVRTAQQLDGLMPRLEAQGLCPARLDRGACERLLVRDAVAVADHSGNPIEIVVRPQHKGRRYFPSRDAGITSFSGVALRTTEPEADLALWCGVFGAKVSDHVGRSAYLRIDGRHHRVALHPSSRGGLLSVTFEVEDLNNIMQNHYFLSDQQVRIVHGPGREPFSGEMFVSFQGPGGVVFSYACGMADVGCGWRPRQFADAADSFCDWGSSAQIPELAGPATKGTRLMIELMDVCYARLGTRDLDTASSFATRILGLQVAGRNRKTLSLRSDERSHSLFYFDGDPADQVIGFEVADSRALEEAGATLERLGHPTHRGTEAECDSRRVQDFIGFRDPSGTAIELAVQPERAGRRYFPSRDAGITSFSHVGLFTRDPVRDEAFWTQVCNARVSDRIGDVPLMRVGSIHHTIALIPAARSGIQHINHQVATTDDIMRSNSLLLEHGVPIVFGPGRHPTSSARFLYFQAPDGMVFEYSVGVKDVDEETYRERQFGFEPSSFCMWGSKPALAELRG